MKETLIRALSGAVYVALIVGLAFIPSIWSIFFFLTLAMIASREFGQLFWKRSNGRIETIVYMVSATFAGMIAPLMLESLNMYQGLLVPLFSLIITLMIILRNSSNVRSAIAGLGLAVLLIAVPFALLVYLREAGYQLFLGIFILLWVNDTFAYVWGRLLGRKKLIPRISPGKTVEGLIGGVLSTMAVGFLIGKYWESLTPIQWMLSAGTISLFATVGDLIESALKRQRGVKDSGNIMPGHGGILDRFDGMFLAAPAYFILLKAFSTL